MKSLLIVFLIAMPLAAQTSTIDWTNVHQVIDGFGASSADTSPTTSMTPALENFFFNGLGFSLYRESLPLNAPPTWPGDCSSISTSCAGPFVSDMQAEVAAGGRIYVTPWSPPAIYTTSGTISCGSTSSSLATGHYADYATWMANHVQSLAAQGIPVYAMSLQNEPNGCHDYASAQWTGAQYDTFITANLAPTFTSAGISTLIFLPEESEWTGLPGTGATCMADPTCVSDIGGNNFHAYDAKYLSPISGGPPYTGTGGMSNPWASANKKYWMTEVSGVPGSSGINAPGCTGSEWCPTIADGMMWGGLIENLLAVQNLNAFLYWNFLTNDQGYNLSLTYLPSGTTAFPATISRRAYVMGQYARFIRPGYVRIDATHIPQAGITVSAYKSLTSGVLSIIATNQTASPVTQSFSIIDAPAFTTLTPWITSATLSISQQPPVTLSGNTFSYSLPAYSVTTFSTLQFATLTSGKLVAGSIL